MLTLSRWPLELETTTPNINITNIIKHMKDAIQLPPVINDSWFSWLKSLGQVWPAWFLTIIIPYVMLFLLLCTLIPCVLKWLSNVLMKNIYSGERQYCWSKFNFSPHSWPRSLPQLRLWLWWHFFNVFIFFYVFHYYFLSSKQLPWWFILKYAWNSVPNT